MCVDAEFMQRVVDFAREQEVVVVHDLAYADLGFDGYSPPSILQAEGAKEVAVELYSMTKSFSMAGWRVAFMAGNPEIVAALAKMKSYLDYGTFQPIQIAATVTMNEMPDYPAEACAIYESRRNALCDGLARIGWEVEPPKARCSRGRRSRPNTATWARRVRFDAGEGSQRGALPGRRFRSRWRGQRPLRADRERAAHRSGGAQSARGADPPRRLALELPVAAALDRSLPAGESASGAPGRWLG